MLLIPASGQRLAIFALLLVNVIAQAEQPRECQANIEWRLKEHLCEPETALFIPSLGRWLVSNICGFAANGKGYLSLVHSDGRMDQARWLDGLNAPAGMALYQGRIYLADFDRVRIIEIASGKIVDELNPQPTPGALNDIAVDRNGMVYVSDSARHSVLEVTKTSSRAIPQAGVFRFANGLHIHDQQLLVGGEKSLILDLQSHHIRPMEANIPLDLDGIESDGLGGWVLSPVGGAVWHINAGGDTRIWRGPGISSTNIGYHPATRQVVVPTGYDNELIAFRLTEKACRPAASGAPDNDKARK